MNWYEFAINPKVILGYYDCPPSLNNVALHRVSFLRDGPTAEIVFNVTEFPSKPSKSWPNGANTCQITIVAIGLSEVELTQWGTGVKGDLNITQAHNAVEIQFFGEGRFRFLCSHLQISAVSGYIDGQF